jgi:hypothetical protein
MSLMTLLDRLERRGEIAGLVLLVLCAIYGFFFPRSFFEGYLTAYIFWIEITFGCLALLLLQYLTGGLWGLVISRVLEAGMTTLPLGALLFVPILLGMTWLFPWTHPATLPEAVRHLIHEKRAYLNVPFFVARNIVYFLLLGGLVLLFRRLSLRRTFGHSTALRSMQNMSGPSLIVFVLVMNFVTVDWIMSLKPEWYSSMLVVEFGAEQAVVGMAFCILALRGLAGFEPMRGALSTKVVHDLGKLLLGFTCFWTYVTFSEYLITWTGNLPHEAAWFADRSSAGWRAWAVLLVLIHFFVPMFCLIMTYISKNLVRLSRVAALMIVAHFVQTVWWVDPGFAPHFQIAWTAPVLIVALGGFWIASFARHLGSASLLPPHDPDAFKDQSETP